MSCEANSLVPLNLRHLREICNFRRRVISALPDPDHIYPEADEEKFVSYHLGQHAATFGAWEGNTLVAYACIGRTRNDLYGFDHIIPHDLTEGSCTLGGCLVARESRNLGFQKSLIARRLDWACKIKASRVFVLVSPSNGVSRANLRRFGFKDHARLKLRDDGFGEKIRDLLIFGL